MRHGKGFNHLSRKSAHRKAMLSNMATSLIMNKRIKTTVAKAKALRSYVEPLITKSKDDSTHSRRVVFSHLQNKEGVSELFRDVAVKVATREGGYTRIIKTGTRLGDNAEMCIIELVDYNELMLAEKDTAAKTSKKTRQRTKKKGSTVTAVSEKKENVKAEAKTEKPENKIVEDIITDKEPEVDAEMSVHTTNESAMKDNEVKLESEEETKGEKEEETDDKKEE
jgi:large subunit ribosomal protein L17